MAESKLKVKKDPEKDLKPKEIVSELDKYIIGQKKAKRAVAIALRNRSRRKRIDKELRDEIAPKNIIMIGATGVGKTEIARRLANLSDAPFLKVEATKFTEVGYVGRDVESMVRDLVGIALNSVKQKARVLVEKEAEKLAEDMLLDILFPNMGPIKMQKKDEGSGEAEEMVDQVSFSTTLGVPEKPTKNEEDSKKRTRDKMRQKLRRGDFEDIYVEIEQGKQNVRNTFIEFSPDAGFDQMDSMLQNIMGNMGSGRKKSKSKVKDARKILVNQMVDKLIDNDKVVNQAVSQVENMGIIFLDEIDKIASRESAKGADVSREGVQRDILPLVEGSAVNTRYGVVKTDHILFIAAGAFHMSSPSDLIPELQGRFPIRVELDNLTPKNLEQILVEPKNALTKQYIALLKTEGIDIKFTAAAVKEISRIASEVNQRGANIGARRLSTVMEKLLEDILFDAPDVKSKKISIDKKDVIEKLKDIIEDKDLTKYIL